VIPKPKTPPPSSTYVPVTEPQFTAEATLNAMRTAGIKESVIYAYQQTGRLIQPQARAIYDSKTLASWDAAIQEWETLHGQKDQQPDTDPAPASQAADAGY
jgi:hypothetical protein